MAIHTILVIVAIILFALAAFNVPGGRVQLGWLGLAFFAAAFIF